MSFHGRSLLGFGAASVTCSRLSFGALFIFVGLAFQIHDVTKKFDRSLAASGDNARRYRCTQKIGFFSKKDYADCIKIPPNTEQKGDPEGNRFFEAFFIKYCQEETVLEEQRQGSL